MAVYEYNTSVTFNLPEGYEHSRSYNDDGVYVDQILVETYINDDGEEAVKHQYTLTVEELKVEEDPVLELKEFCSNTAETVYAVIEDFSHPAAFIAKTVNLDLGFLNFSRTIISTFIRYDNYEMLNITFSIDLDQEEEDVLQELEPFIKLLKSLRIYGEVTSLSKVKAKELAYAMAVENDAEYGQDVSVLLSKAVRFPDFNDTRIVFHSFNDDVELRLPVGFETFTYFRNTGTKLFSFVGGKYQKEKSKNETGFEYNFGATCTTLPEDGSVTTLRDAMELTAETLPAGMSQKYVIVPGKDEVAFATWAIGGFMGMQSVTILARVIVDGRYTINLHHALPLNENGFRNSPSLYKPLLDFVKEMWIDGQTFETGGLTEQDLAKLLKPDFEASGSEEVLFSPGLSSDEIAIEQEAEPEMDVGFTEVTADQSLYPHYDRLEKLQNRQHFPGVQVVVNAGGTEYEFKSLASMAKSIEAWDEVEENRKTYDLYKRIAAMETGAYSLDQKAEEWRNVFKVDTSVFDPKHDRFCELRDGLMHRAYMMSALRSFAWTLADYCKQTGTAPKDVPYSVIYQMVQFASERSWHNYDGNTYCKGLCGCSDLHVFYVPDAISNVDREQLKPDKEELEYAENIEKLQEKWGTENEDAVMSTVHSLDALREDLAYIYPAVEKIYQSLAASRNKMEPLLGDEADILYAWCALAGAAKEPFFTEDGPMTCYFGVLSGNPYEVTQEEDPEEVEKTEKEWMEEYGEYLEKDPKISFKGRKFVFTGVIARDDEKEDPLVKRLEKLRGEHRSKVSGLTNYLVVNPRRAGVRKIEEALDKIDEGKKLQIIHIDDFMAALEREEKVAALAKKEDKDASFNPVGDNLVSMNDIMGMLESLCELGDRADNLDVGFQKLSEGANTSREALQLTLMQFLLILSGPNASITDAEALMLNTIHNSTYSAEEYQSVIETLDPLEESNAATFTIIALQGLQDKIQENRTTLCIDAFVSLFNAAANYFCNLSGKANLERIKEKERMIQSMHTFILENRMDIEVDAEEIIEDKDAEKTAVPESVIATQAEPKVKPKSEEDLNRTYQNALALAGSDSVNRVREAKEQFESLGCWKDAKEQARSCEYRLVELQKKIKDEQKNIEKAQTQHGRKKNYLVIGCIGFAILVMIVIGFVVPYIQKSNLYHEAITLGEAGQYEEAIAILAELSQEDFKDSYAYMNQFQEAQEEEQEREFARSHADNLIESYEDWYIKDCAFSELMEAIDRIDEEALYAGQRASLEHIRQIAEELDLLYIDDYDDMKSVIYDKIEDYHSTDLQKLKSFTEPSMMPLLLEELEKYEKYIGGVYSGKADLKDFEDTYLSGDAELTLTTDLGFQTKDGKQLSAETLEIVVIYRLEITLDEDPYDSTVFVGYESISKLNKKMPLREKYDNEFDDPVLYFKLTEKNAVLDSNVKLKVEAEQGDFL